MKKAIIFDLDGTLLNTIMDLGEACNAALTHYGFPTHRLDEYPHLVGNGVNKLIERALPAGHKDEETVLRLRKVFIPYYDEHKCVHTRPYEGMETVIKELKRRGYKLAVASNKYNAATQALVKHYFGDQFDIVLGEREGVRRKPDPQIVNDIMAALDVGQEEVLYVGDSDVDIQTARNAGVASAGCSWGFCKQDVLNKEQPKYIIDSPSELLNLLQQGSAGCDETYTTMGNKHSYMKAIGILAVFAVLCLASCSDSYTKKASKRFQTAQLYAQNGQFSSARQEIDSIHTLYPKAVDIRRQAKHLSDSIAYVEAVRTYHYSDSVRNELLLQADELLKKFCYEKNPAYEDHGKYVHKLLRTRGNNASRCYLQCYIGDDRMTTLKSYYYGTKQINHREIELSSKEESIRKEGTNHTFENEGWHEITSFEEDASLALLHFISTHREDRIQVRLDGNSPYVYYLQENERTALDETYHLGILMHDIKHLEDAMRSADRTIGKWGYRKDEKSE